MRTQAEVQDFYARSGANFARYWLDFIRANRADGAALHGELQNVLSALDLADRYDLADVLIEGVDGIYQACEDRGLYALMGEQLDRAKRAAHSCRDTAALALIALRAGRIAMRLERFDAARSHWHHGLDLARRLDDPGLMGRTETELGVLAIESRHYTEAEEHLQQALILAQRSQDPEQISVILGELCRAAYFQRNFDQAETYANHALILTETHGFDHRTTGLLVYLGIIQEERGDNESARRYWERGLPLARQVGNLARICNLLVNLGMSLNAAGEWDRAEPYLLEGLDLARQLGKRQETSHLLMDLGLLYGRQGNPGQAERFMAESMQLARDIGHPPLIAFNLLQQGEYFLEQRAWQQAASSFQECTPLAQAEGRRDREKGAAAFWGLARAQAGLGQSQEAVAAAETSLALYEELDHHHVEILSAWLASQPR